MPRMLFVCTGNICRSAFAERYATHVAACGRVTSWQFTSAGVAALVGAPMDELMALQAAAHGADASGFLSRQLTPGIVQEADLVVGMEARHRKVVLEDHPGKVRRTFTLGQLVRSANDHPNAWGAEFLEVIGRSRPRAHTHDDIVDPYRCGLEAARRTADRISTLLDVVLPRLLDV